MAVVTQERPIQPLARYKWTREQLYRVLNSGAFGDNPKFELIAGELVIEGMMDRIMQKSLHAWGITQMQHALNEALPEGFLIRVQLPLSLQDHDVEPDLCLVPGRVYDYKDSHPTAAALVVEVSESTLHFDRSFKASLYAAAGIQDYWILNLVERVLEVRRNRAVDSTTPFGFRYEYVERLTAEHTISPLAAPGIVIAVETLIP